MADATRKRRTQTNPRSLANLTPEVSALKHGANRMMSRGLAPPCGKCLWHEGCEHYREGGTCVVAETLQAEVFDQVMAEPGLRPVDAYLVHEYSKIVVAMAITDSYVSRTGGPFLPGAENGYLETQPALQRWRLGLTSQAVKLANALGITPSTRSRLEQQSVADAGAVLQQALRDAIEAERQTIDATATEIGTAEVSSDDTDGR